MLGPGVLASMLDSNSPVYSVPELATMLGCEDATITAAIDDLGMTLDPRAGGINRTQALEIAELLLENGIIGTVPSNL